MAKVLNQCRFDGVFLDVNMPRTSGVEALGKNRVFGLRMTDYHSGYMFYSRRAMDQITRLFESNRRWVDAMTRTDPDFFRTRAKPAEPPRGNSHGWAPVGALQQGLPPVGGAQHAIDITEKLPIW